MFARITHHWHTASAYRKIAIVGAFVVFLAGIAAVTPYFISRQVNEDFPVAQPQIAPAAQAPATSVSAAAAPAAPAAPSGPVALSRGSFTQIDPIHGAEGTATIYRLEDGNLVLRLENFTSTNGPDLFIGLSGHPKPRSSRELHDQGYVEIAALKGNQGNQNYELPADIDLSAFKSVTIYCRAFSVMFSSAELAGGL
jgi:hypothetical protein